MTDGYVPLGELLIREAARTFECDGINGRKNEQVQAKRAVIYILHQHGWSRPRIARKLRLDRSTVLYHDQQARRELVMDCAFAASVDHLMRFLPADGAAR